MILPLELIYEIYDSSDLITQIKIDKITQGNMKKEFNWGYISAKQVLSEDFIKEFSHKVHWEYISRYQVLSENFIKERSVSEKVDWEYISRYQVLSEEFIKEYSEKVDWVCISIYIKFYLKI
jgi:hypothetical protein